MDYTKVVSEVVTRIKPSGIRRFFDLTSQMKDVISLGIGEPDFPTPDFIREVGARSIDEGRTKYTMNIGNLELREEITRYVKRKYDVEYNALTDVLVTVGGSEAVDMSLRAIITPGDEIIIPEPAYVCYEPLTSVAGGVPVFVTTRAEDGFKLTPEVLAPAITEKTKAILFSYPTNPTGAIMEREDYLKLIPLLRDTNIILISDEIYAELTFGGKRHVSPASIDGLYERTILINGFSKAFSMTGWRLGYACAPEPIMTEMKKIHQFAVMSASTTSQIAGVAALRDGDEATEMMRREYDKRRKILVDGFNEMGLSCAESLGAFYSFPCIRSTGLSSDEFCERLLREKRVAVIPGNAFGSAGEGFVRASYCYSEEHIKEALSRIKEFVEELKAEKCK
ncbi:MAG: aminotransferase class I/II-fold pyridoxal phosphate-dependent enzyme [Clostridia bacterium]|nr:aminotransferase class I/II-fold pyridoxal phosphate-dependent enzyme [Clostridia bacterium]